MCGGWFTDGWLGQGCWYLLVVKCLRSFLYLGVVLYYYYFILFFTIVAGFGIHREYEDSSIDLIDIK